MVTNLLDIFDRAVGRFVQETSEEFARFYLETFVPDAHPDSLFHMHDILPPGATVMYRPLEAMRKPSVRPKAWGYRVLRAIAPGSVPDHFRHWVESIPVDRVTSEALLGHRLAGSIPEAEQVYTYTIVERYPDLDGHRYDDTSVWRCSGRGRPLEWNDSWWTLCGALARVYRPQA